MMDNNVPMEFRLAGHKEVGEPKDVGRRSRKTVSSDLPIVKRPKEVKATVVLEEPNCKKCRRAKCQRGSRKVASK
jgi:hypothetical protein